MLNTDCDINKLYVPSLNLARSIEESFHEVDPVVDIRSGIALVLLL